MTVTNGRDKKKNGRLRTSVAVSVLLHLQFVAVAALMLHRYAPRTADLAAAAAAGESVEVATLDEETSREIERKLEQQEEEEKQEDAEEQKKAEDREIPSQVVELARPTEEKAPHEARFAAEYDSSVEKETKKHGKLDETARLGVSDRDQAARPATPPSPPGAQQKPSIMAMRSPSPGAGGPGAAGMPAPPPMPPTPAGQSDETEASPPPSEGSTSMGGGGPQARAQKGQIGLAALLPSTQQLASAVGSGTEDYVEDIDEGPETALNAKRWKFASFFNRIKEQVRQHWRPASEYQRRDPTGAIYGNQARYTVLLVQLREDGTLADVNVAKASGVEFLDDVAVEALRKAQPFVNPPRQLVNEAGLIKFRCGFFFDASGAPKLRVFKYNGV